MVVVDDVKAALGISTYLLLMCDTLNSSEIYKYFVKKINHIIAKIALEH